MNKIHVRTCYCIWHNIVPCYSSIVQCMGKSLDNKNQCYSAMIFRTSSYLPPSVSLSCFYPPLLSLLPPSLHLSLPSSFPPFLAPSLLPPPSLPSSPPLPLPPFLPPSLLPPSLSPSLPLSLLPSFPPSLLSLPLSLSLIFSLLTYIATQALGYEVGRPLKVTDLINTEILHQSTQTCRSMNLYISVPKLKLFCVNKFSLFLAYKKTQKIFGLPKLHIY